MRSMKNQNNSDYQSSTILEHDSTSEPLDVFLKWLKSYQNLDLNKNELVNNPAFTLINQEGESIKIENVRNFNQELSFSNYNNQTRYFVFLNSDLMTLQAQNASLKSIEEPPPNTKIVLLTSTIEKIIPTIISRCQVIPIKNNNKQANQENSLETARIYDQILNSKHFELITFTDKYKEREDAIILLNQLLQYLHKELKQNSKSFENKHIVKHLSLIISATKHLNQNANVKLVMENLFFEFIAD